MPLGNVLDAEADDRRVAERHLLVLRVLVREERERVAMLFAGGEQVRDAVKAYPRAARPDLLVVVDHDARAAVRLDVADPSQIAPILDRLRLRESVRLIKRLLSEDYVTFDGRYFSVEDAKIFDKPDRPLPILIAAGGPQAATLAGREGDGVIVTSGKGPELYSDTLVPAFERSAREGGKDPAMLERMIEMKVSFDHDLERATKETEEWAALALPAEDKAGVADPRELAHRAEAVADQAHSRFIVSDDPDGHVAQLRPYLDLGFTHLVFHFPGADQERAMRLYAEEILPRLRR